MGLDGSAIQGCIPGLLACGHSLTGKGGAFVWGSTAPVRADATNGAKNPRVEQRNAVALDFVKAADIPLDDQHALMPKHQDLYEDSISRLSG